MLSSKPKSNAENINSYMCEAQLASLQCVQQAYRDCNFAYYKPQQIIHGSFF